MSQGVDLNDELAVPESSVDPRRLRAELVRYFSTAIRYVVRQGLSYDELRNIVSAVQAELHAKTAKRVLPKPELLNKGINDMRDRIN